MASRKMIVFPSKNELSEAMAEYTANLSAKFCKEKGLFTVVLSGGDLIDWLWSLILTLLIHIHVLFFSKKNKK